MKDLTRRRFLTTLGTLGTVAALGDKSYAIGDVTGQIPVYGHLWIYASAFPPNWDCTANLAQVFEDFKYAGIEGIEVMESLLKNPDILSVAGDLIEKHDLPVIGSSYYADMWMKNERSRILEEVEFVVERLRQLGGTKFGITVGDARRMKTEEELDAQAIVLQDVMKICAKNGIEPNVHNHTFEVANDLHDLKGIIARVPEVKLGPDLSWLARAGVDPVEFIREYGDCMVYMHIRDNTAENKFADSVGEGVLDFPAIAKALRDVGFSGSAAIELAYDSPPTRPTRDNWKLSREYVKNVFGW